MGSFATGFFAKTPSGSDAKSAGGLMHLVLGCQSGHLAAWHPGFEPMPADDCLMPVNFSREDCFA
jgi:hypothetical protein